MSHPKEYVTTGALMQCSEGMAPMPFKATPRTTKVGGFKVGNELDVAPVANIPSFIICKKLTQMAGGVPTPCMPVPGMWQDTYTAKMGGGRALLKMSCIRCSAGQGKIEFLTSGQAPLPPDVVEGMQTAQGEAKEVLEKAQKEKDSVGEAGLAEGLIPIWGSGRDLVHSIQTGNGWGIALNAGFLLWDVASVVAGVFSFGTATAAMMAGKAGVRTALKAAGKVVVSAAKKQGGELLARSAKAFKNVAGTVVDFTKGIKCKFLKACFPAGTPVAVKGGYKNIEDIQAGDLVWAWDPETGGIGLKPVVRTMQSEADTLIEITSGSETILATRDHPFRVGDGAQGGWRNAEDLTEKDELWLLDKRNKAISGLEAKPQGKPVKVYNFEVADWHTYFVGLWMVLVHNAGVCLYELARQGEKHAQDILRGIKFNRVMAKRMVANAVHELWLAVKGGKKARVDSILKEGGIVSRKATQLAEVEERTAKNYIDELKKKYKQGREIVNKERAGMDKLKGGHILQIPKQEAPIPQGILDYAKLKRVKIDEIKDVTMEMLKNW